MVYIGDEPPVGSLKDEMDVKARNRSFGCSTTRGFRQLECGTRGHDPNGVARNRQRALQPRISDFGRIVLAFLEVGGKIPLRNEPPKSWIDGELVEKEKQRVAGASELRKGWFHPSADAKTGQKPYASPDSLLVCGKAPERRDWQKGRTYLLHQRGGLHAFVLQISGFCSADEEAKHRGKVVGKIDMIVVCETMSAHINLACFEKNLFPRGSRRNVPEFIDRAERSGHADKSRVEKSKVGFQWAGAVADTWDQA
ncbi:hypothetical protein B0H13DRAFT_1910016 [Mycena leptocephala]|nr:hypothetical protein B0H13DRAFT_1910016 [Mycena leptocephala]